ncbi:MAG: hypothetical protein N4A41_12690 [Crocinitomicaceae bacterium]|jgi:hypothetical protein|nr:hypothetical protein [Crocinitomicaceae bacterium]
MVFTGSEDHKITLAEGSELTENYRTTLMTYFNGIKGGYIGGDDMKELLDQDDVVGFRYYYGLSSTVPPVPQVVFVGVDANGNDVTNGIILDKAELCPSKCAPDNPLNS